MAKKSELAVVDETENLPAVAGFSLEDMAGQGFDEVRNEDVAIPFLRILAQLSPQVNKRDGAYVQGAEAGMFYNSGTNQVYDGESGLPLVPVYFYFRYLEWKPRESGGGFVASYTPEEGAELLKNTHRNDKGQDILSNGNLLAPTAHHFCLILGPNGPQRVLVTMSSTQLKKSRKWNLLMGEQKATRANGTRFVLPSFACVYKAKTVPESNDKGDWFGFDISLDRQLSDKSTEDISIMMEAKDFYDSVKKGAVNVRHESDEAPVSGGARADLGDENIPF